MCQEPFSTLTELATPSKSGYRLCRNTVRQYLAKNEYYAFCPHRKPSLTLKHKKERLKFDRKMQFWKLSDVACICFSDKSTFEISLCTKPRYVRRRYGHNYESRYLQPSFKSGRSSVGVWGVISLDVKSELVIIPQGKRMNSKRYIQLVLNEGPHPFYDKVMEHHGDAIWQEDGARYHTSKATRSHEETLRMIRLEWPAQSPDLNPIEHLWRIMKLRISKRRHRLRSIEELEDILLEEWANLRPKDWYNIISSFQRRCKEVIRNKGGSTRYSFSKCI